MVEKIGPIKNPLTIIAIFAAIAEISGTLVLPFISETNQSTYIWFLMVFPLLLVVLFFVTLNFNHNVLYAPSDFKDEGNFFKAFQPASPTERDEKLREEVREVTEEANQAPPTSSTGTEVAQTSKVRSSEPIHSMSSIQARYALAEDLILNKIAQETGEPVRRDVRLESPNFKYIFDGAIVTTEKVTAIEVKYVRDQISTSKRVREVIKKVAEVAAGLPEPLRSRFSLMLALATDLPEEQHRELASKVRSMIDATPFPVEVRIFGIARLEKEFSN